jgi:hypothetical protein
MLVNMLLRKMLKDDLVSKRKRRRDDYAYHLEYRTRWLVISCYMHGH